MCSESLLPAVVLEARSVFREWAGTIWTSVRSPCRVLFLDTTSGAEDDLLGFLEESGLSLSPDTRVVVAGVWASARHLLLHHTMRNTRHAVYIAPTPPPSLQRAPADENVTTGNTVDPPPGDMYEVHCWLTILRRCLYCNASMAGVQVIHTGLLQAATETEAERVAALVAGSLSDDEEEDLQGRLLRVVGLHHAPYTRYILSPHGPAHPVTPLPSLDFSILDTVAATLNFTYEARRPKVKEFGLPLGDGNWSGTVGTLQHEEADFSFMLSMTPGRIQVADYSRVYNSESLCIMSSKSKTLPQYLQIMKPLEGVVWGVTAAIIVCWGLALWLFRRLWSRLEGSSDGRGDLAHALLHSWGTMLGDSPAPSPSLTSGRVLFACLLLFSLVMSTAYRSSFIAHLTIVTKMQPIDSFEDLVAQQDWTWGVELPTGSIYLYFTYATDPVRREVNSKMQYHSLEEGMERLLKGRHSVIANQYMAIIEVRSYYTLKSGYTPIHISSTVYPVFAGVSWGFRRGAPFRLSISYLKQRLIEAGLIDHWMDEAVEATTEAQILEGGRRVLQVSSQEPEGGGNVVLSMQHLQGIFYLLGLGCVVSLLTFGREMLNPRPTHRC